MQRTSLQGGLRLHRDGRTVADDVPVDGATRPPTPIRHHRSVPATVRGDYPTHTVECRLQPRSLPTSVDRLVSRRCTGRLSQVAPSTGAESAFAVPTRRASRPIHPSVCCVHSPTKHHGRGEDTVLMDGQDTLRQRPACEIPAWRRLTPITEGTRRPEHAPHIDG